MKIITLQGLKTAIAELIERIANAFDSLDARVLKVEDDYLSKTQGGTVSNAVTVKGKFTTGGESAICGTMRTKDVYVGQFDSLGNPMSDADKAVDSGYKSSLRVNGTAALHGDIIGTENTTLDIGNINCGGKVIADTLEVGNISCSGNVKMNSHNIEGVQSITVTGTVRGATYKAPKLDATEVSGTRIGKSTEPYADVYATNFHGALDGNAKTASTASAVAWANVSGKPTLGTLAGKNSLTAADVGAAPASHSHKAADISDLSTSLDAKYLKLTGGTVSGSVVIGTQTDGTPLGDLAFINGYDCTVIGKACHAEGQGNTINANTDYAHAEGTNNKILYSCHYSHAEGSNNAINSGYSCHVEGVSNQVNFTGSHAEGYNTIAGGPGAYAHAEGGYTQATGKYSHAEGYNTIAGGNWQHVTGKCNKEDSTHIFIVGCGTNEDTHRDNAFWVSQDGSIHAKAELATGGADYAEYFEWADGNPENEDRRGLFVTLDGDKIKTAEPGDYVLGIVSAAPTVLGNSYDCNWKDMYLKDVYGQPLKQEVTTEEHTDENGVHFDEYTTEEFIINPEFDYEKEYIPRSKRQEWTAIGMLGVLVANDDGSCTENGCCQVGKGGIAVKADTGYRVLKRLDDTHIRVLIK